jgi:hypothetical protein
MAGKPSFALAGQQILAIAGSGGLMRPRGERRRSISTPGEAVVVE